MKLKDIMTTDVRFLRPNTTLKECGQWMKALDIGAIPICDGERIVGIVTDRDLTLQGTAEGLAPAETPVSRVMSTPVIYCYEDDEIARAAHLMETKQIRRLVVINREKRLTGIVALGDLAAKSSDKDLSEEVLEKVSEPVRGRAA